jgi:predicted nuclease of predicted toxin-antitoxin system
MALKFHLDEHVPRAIAEGLRRRGIDVTTTVDAGLISATDFQHVEFARREHRVIYTQDDDFLTLAASGMKHCGVVYNHSEARTIRQIIEFLELLSDCLTGQEMVDHVEFA